MVKGFFLRTYVDIYDTTPKLHDGYFFKPAPPILVFCKILSSFDWFDWIASVMHQSRDWFDATNLLQKIEVVHPHVAIFSTGTYWMIGLQLWWTSRVWLPSPSSLHCHEQLALPVEDLGQHHRNTYHRHYHRHWTGQKNYLLDLLFLFLPIMRSIE